MNGDEVRGTRFIGPTGKLTRGYDVAEVDALLRRLAAELDAERQVGPLIENAVFRTRVGTQAYDSEAVDWFLEQLRSQEDHPEPARMSDPWRDLPVGNYFTRGRPGDLAEGPAPPSWQARRKDRAQDQECLARECADACRDFGQQPGTQLRWVVTHGGYLYSVVRGELLTAEQQTLASVRTRSLAMDRATVSTGERTFTWKRAAGRHAKAGSLNDAVRALLVPNRELLDETGTPILCGSGQNYSYIAGACITFPDQRWLKFPVRGTETENAIMTAVDQAGNKVARYRSLAVGGVLGGEITVHPRQQLTNELVLALVISAPWLHSYFTSSGGGG